MTVLRKFAISICAVATFAAPAAVLTMAPASASTTSVVAEPNGSGGPDGHGGGGGCSSGPGWQGCGGWNPAQGGFGSGCINGICGGWDGSRGWGG